MLGKDWAFDKAALACTGLALLILVCGCSESSAARIKRIAGRSRGDDTAAANPPNDNSQQKPTATEDPSPKSKSQPRQSNTAKAEKQPPATAPPPPPSASESAVKDDLARGSGEIRKVVNNDPPATTPSPAERRSRSLANLERIGRALTAYVAKHNRLPPQALQSSANQKTLSWRVAILPELGYQDLYDQFDVDESWDGPRNKQLLMQIPPEYQSPERFDTSTNYLSLAGSGFTFGATPGLKPDELKGGPDSKVAIVEVNKEEAVPWTAPRDWMLDGEEPCNKLGGLRDDGFFAVLASGRLALLTPAIWNRHWVALCAISRKDDSLELAAVLRAPPAEVPALAAAKGGADSAGVVTSAAAVPANEKPTAAEPKAVLEIPLPPLPDLSARIGRSELSGRPIPDEEALAKSREQLKEAYKEPQAARAIPDRIAFARRLLTDAARVDPQSPDRYEMLRVARDEAARLGDVQSAFAACAVLEKEYRVDAMSMRFKVLEGLKKAAKTLQPVDGAFQEASRLTREAFEADRYEIALPAHEIRIEFGRIIGAKLHPKSGPVNFRRAPQFGGTKDSPQEKLLKAELARMQQESELLTAAQTMYEAEKKALNVLATKPNGPDACEVVGRYLCFVKDEWDLGLPFLVRAADIKLRFLASIDLTKNRTVTETLSLGDEYYDLATENKQPQKRGLHLRAARCYSVALRESAATLQTLKTQKRMIEIAALYGPLDMMRVFPKDASSRGIAVSE